MASETEWAYLAGIIDGEGTICITGRPRMVVAIYNSNPDLLDWIKLHFGGYVNWTPSRKPEWKPIGRVQFADSFAIEILRGVLPFLVLKRRQAKIVLAYHETRLPLEGGRRQGVPWQLAGLREGMRLKLKQLNKRGPVHACGQ